MNDSLDAQVAHWKAVYSASNTQTAFRLSQAVQVQQPALGLRGRHGTLQTIELPEPPVRWQDPEFLWGPALGHICLPKAFQVLTDFCSSNPGHTMSVERPGDVGRTVQVFYVVFSHFHGQRTWCSPLSGMDLKTQ